MSLINIKNLTFSYDNSYENIFENVNLQLDTDWRLALVGRNGKGKTTLLNLILGKYEFIGKIESSVDFVYFPFEVQNGNDFVINIAKELLPNILDWQLKKELSLLQLPEDILYRVFNTLSGGEQVKLMLAVLFLLPNTFLLIDEPTNHLDSFGRKILAEYLKTKSGFIIVSHDRTFLDNCVEYVLSINNSNIQLQKGNLSTYLDSKQKQDSAEMELNSKLQLEVSRLKDSMEQAANWSGKVEATKFGGKQKSGLRPDRGAIGAKAAKMMKRAKVIEKRIEKSIDEKSSLLKNIDRNAPLQMDSMEHFADILIQITNLTVSYDNKVILKDFNLQVNKGQRLAIVGKNGSGKTTILKAILGQILDYYGTIKVASRLKISYVSQDTSFLHGSIEDFCLEWEISKSRLLSILYTLGFDRLLFNKNIEDYSQGQKKKLLIAKSLCEQAHIYLWDEPLNYIDIISRKQIETLVLQNSITMIFIEHDDYFSNAVATSKIVL